MLTAKIERYISRRQMLGYKLKDTRRELLLFARFAADRGDTHLRVTTATAWANRASSPHARHQRMRRIHSMARVLHAEDMAHEVPPMDPFRHRYRRPLPYIYSPEEISRLIGATRQLRNCLLRKETYATLIGLIAATGLRISEAMNLRFDDVLAGGILNIRMTKFGKSRLVPLHPTAKEALDHYLALRRKIPSTDDHVFIGSRSRRPWSQTVNFTFRRLLKLAGIAPVRGRAPRIHDLRHTFATRALEQCPSDHQSVGRHFVALSTYLGHVDVKNTFWYLEATPELMSQIVRAAEKYSPTGGPQ
jgi:integrase/recombinase XerD